MQLLRVKLIVIHTLAHVQLLKEKLTQTLSHMQLLRVKVTQTLTHGQISRMKQSQTLPQRQVLRVTDTYTWAVVESDAVPDARSDTILQPVDDTASDICNKAFTATNCLKKCVRVQTKIPYACDICNKAFITAGCLKKHERIHTETQPTGCDG